MMLSRWVSFGQVQVGLAIHLHPTPSDDPTSFPVLDKSVSLYYTTLGIRSTIKYVDAPVPLNVWHTLRAEFQSKRIRILLNGKLYIEVEDDHIKEPGAVGVWTKADSVTAFDDFNFGAR
jgi:hypothetical protein